MRIVLLVILTLILLCCKESKVENFDSYTKKIDSLASSGSLVKYFHPNKTCGGNLDGFYKNDELMLIEASECGEYSCSYQKMYFKNGKIHRINYTKHIAQLNQYYEKRPYSSENIDLSKMVFSDTIFEIGFDKEITFIKKYNDSVISKEIDSILLNRLLNCGNEMVKNLEAERKLFNDL